MGPRRDRDRAAPPGHSLPCSPDPQAPVLPRLSVTHKQRRPRRYFLPVPSEGPASLPVLTQIRVQPRDQAAPQIQPAGSWLFRPVEAVLYADRDRLRRQRRVPRQSTQTTATPVIWIHAEARYDKVHAAQWKIVPTCQRPNKENQTFKLRSEDWHEYLDCSRNLPCIVWGAS